MEKIENGEFLIHSFEGKDCHNLNGLTKREYFAGLAMQAVLSNHNFMFQYKGLDLMHPSDVIASASVNYADELLKRLEQ